MYLQLALDRMSRKDCIRVTTDVKDYMDLIEIGTSVVKEYGMSIVREMRNMFPDKIIVADVKTCDSGAYEAKQVFEAGADVSTVMAFSSNLTIQQTQQVAKQYQKQMVVDLLEVQQKERLYQLEKIGVEFVSLHVGTDKQQKSKFDVELFSLLDGFDFKVSVAGGIDLQTLPSIIAYKPDVIIVGSAITSASNPREVARKMRGVMESQGF